MNKKKALLAAAAITVYIALPAYRYYMIASFVGMRIMGDRPRYRVVPKWSKHYKRLVG